MALAELAFSPWLAFAAACIGAFLALDAVSFPQVMASRPFISGTLGGLLFGNAVGGMLVGALLELLSMRHPPFGAAKYPDTGPAGLVAGAAYAASGADSIEALVVSLIGGWVVGWIGAYAAYGRRLLNELILAKAGVPAVRPARLEASQRIALGVDAARGFLVTGAFLVPVMLTTALASGMPVAGPGAAFGAAALVTALSASIGAGARASAPDIRAWAMVLLGALLTLAALGWRP